jgi:hypothetical protein
MPFAGADLLAILNGIAAQRHSRTVSVAVNSFIFSQALLYLVDDLRFREELIWATLNVPFGKPDSPLVGLFFCQLTFC